MLATRTRIILGWAEFLFLRSIFAAALAGFLSFAASSACPQGPPPASIDELRLKVQQSPSDPLAHFHLGAALFHQGRINDAAQEFHQALTLRPGLAEAHNDLGIILGQQGKRRKRWKNSARL